MPVYTVPINCAHLDGFGRCRIHQSSSLFSRLLFKGRKSCQINDSQGLKFQDPEDAPICADQKDKWPSRPAPPYPATRPYIDPDA